MIELNNREQQVLIACVRASLECRQGTFDANALANAIEGTEDWPALVQAALDQGMLGILWYCSTLDQLEIFPADIREALATFIHSQRAGNTARTDKLLEVLGFLGDAGIRGAPFKGSLLAENAYGDIGMRSFWDLDFLVPEQDFDRAISVLEQHGFTDTSHPPDGYIFSAKQLAKLWRYWGQAALLRKSDQLAIEPHVAVAPFTLALNYDDLWQRISLSPWRGVQTWQFEPEDQVLILCLQGAKPYWDKIKLPADLAHFLVAHPQLDWEKIIRRATKHGIRRLLALALLMVERLFALALPEMAVKLAHADAEAVRICDCLLHQGESFRYASTDVYKLSRYHLETRERLTDKSKYLWRTIFLPNESYVKSVRLPDSLYWVYSLLKVANDAYLLIRGQLRRIF
jgi:hypothetical protein